MLILKKQKLQSGQAGEREEESDENIYLMKKKILSRAFSAKVRVDLL